MNDLRASIGIPATAALDTESAIRRSAIMPGNHGQLSCPDIHGARITAFARRLPSMPMEDLTIHIWMVQLAICGTTCQFPPAAALRPASLAYLSDVCACPSRCASARSRIPRSPDTSATARPVAHCSSMQREHNSSPVSRQ
jgi:hypothetical protein